MKHIETDWLEFADCSEIYDKPCPSDKDDECEECMELYDTLKEDVLGDMTPTWERKGYGIFDIYESDYHEHPDGSKEVKFALVLKKNVV